MQTSVRFTTHRIRSACATHTTARQGLRDQISNHSSFEREAVHLPDRRPTWRMGRMAAAGVALAVIAAFAYFGFSHQRDARALAPPAALPPVRVSKHLQRAVHTRLAFLRQSA